MNDWVWTGRAWRPAGLTIDQHAEIDQVVAACSRPPSPEWVGHCGSKRDRFQDRNEAVSKGKALLAGARRANAVPLPSQMGTQGDAF